jgi:Flp pilus assembly protein TadB
MNRPESPYYLTAAGLVLVNLVLLLVGVSPWVRLILLVGAVVVLLMGVRVRQERTR